MDVRYCPQLTHDLFDKAFLLCHQNSLTILNSSIYSSWKLRPWPPDPSHVLDS